LVFRGAGQMAVYGGTV